MPKSRSHDVFANLQHFTAESPHGVHIDIQAIAETLVAAVKIAESTFAQGPGDYQANLHRLIDDIWPAMEMRVGDDAAN